MKRLTIRADEVRVGDWLRPQGRNAPGLVVTDVMVPTVRVPGEVVEVFTDADPMGMPAVTAAPSDQVEVWR